MTRMAFRNAKLHSELAGRLGAKPRLLIFDFDGTLAPIAPTPDQARLSKRVKSLLRALSEESQTQIAFVSGRSLPNLQSKIGLKNAVYVGNHGLTADLSNLGFENGNLRKWFKTALKAYHLLKPLADSFAGSSLEFKGPDLTLHYRQLPTGQMQALLQAARQAVRNLPLVVRDGKKALELRPGTNRNKGWAVKRLARMLVPGWRNRGLCLYFGDDLTDEDAFSAMRSLGPRAIGIKVGSGATSAQYRLRNTGETSEFIEALLRSGSGETQHAVRKSAAGSSGAKRPPRCRAFSIRARRAVCTLI